MVVVDASVAYKWLSAEEEYHTLSLDILNTHLTKKNTILVPDLILYELSNAWSTKSRLTSGEVEDNVKIIEKYSLEIVHINFSLLLAMVQFSKKYSVTIYDACYAVLAKKRGCHLITADEKFAEKLNLSYVKKLSDYP